jgi:hypothetical protein
MSRSCLRIDETKRSDLKPYESPNPFDQLDENARYIDGLIFIREGRELSSKENDERKK